MEKTGDHLLCFQQSSGCVHGVCRVDIVLWEGTSCLYPEGWSRTILLPVSQMPFDPHVEWVPSSWPPPSFHRVSVQWTSGFHSSEVIQGHSRPEQPKLREHHSLFLEWILSALGCAVVKPLASESQGPVEKLIVVNSWPVKDNFFLCGFWFCLCFFNNEALVTVKKHFGGTLFLSSSFSHHPIRKKKNCRGNRRFRKTFTFSKSF